MSFFIELWNYFFPQFDKNQTKIFLKTALIRIRLVQSKRNEKIKQLKLEIKNLIKEQKDELARIKVENLIREEELKEAFELIDLFCEKLQAKLDLIEISTYCPEELIETVHSIVYASTLSDITELNKIKEQLELKYGKNFIESIIFKESPHINTMLKNKIKIKKIDIQYIQNYLTEIVGTDYLPPFPNNNSFLPPNKSFVPSNYPDIHNFSNLQSLNLNQTQTENLINNNDNNKNELDLDEIAARFESLKNNIKK